MKPQQKRHHKTEKLKKSHKVGYVLYHHTNMGMKDSGAVVLKHAVKHVVLERSYELAQTDIISPGLMRYAKAQHVWS